ncbi:DUF3024 domain-containing protein [Horticoccus sp. 23ND18S-11]|uniref:DUF3024 domain-containing protein n=1 Tax=Horticoccus sp. 23ND18S-11 TaxID=3391832 RepID=UPI0039C91B9D
MPLPETQVRAAFAAVGAFLEKRRPPVSIRDKLDFRADISGSDVFIVEVRPDHLDKTQKRDTPVAKMKWVAARKVWRLFWMRADLKWHSYKPFPESAEIAVLVDVVDRDSNCCFFG